MRERQRRDEVRGRGFADEEFSADLFLGLQCPVISIKESKGKVHAALSEDCLRPLGRLA